MGIKLIKQTIKNYLVKSLLTVIKGFSYVIKSFFNLLKKLSKNPALFFINCFKFFAVIIYKIHYYLFKLKNAIFPSHKIQLFYFFINKYIPHAIIIILTFTISFANIFAMETKAEEFGDKSLLFVWATGSDLEDEYTEESFIATETQIENYLEESAGTISKEDLAYIPEEAKLPLTIEGSALIKPEITSLDASKIQRDKIIEYTVQQGDTISTVARKFGVSQDTILWENNLTITNYIRPGQILKILPTSGIAYKIAKGDNLSKIVQKYNSDKNKIIEFNRLADESDLQVGQIIIIPEGKPYYPPVAAKPKLASLTKIFQPSHVEVPAGDKMAWPTTARRISQYFNWRHIGLDIDGDFGDPVWAADDGVVIKSVCLKTGYGCHVIIDHGNGKSTLYGHFQKLYVTEGQKVARGDVLGEEGSTGMSTGSHLHFEVRFGGKRYNPLSYIR